MTATASAPRPVLYLVPGPARRPPVRPPAPAAGGAPALVGAAGEYAARTLGTSFVPVASRLAEGLLVRAPLLVRRGRVEAWAAAIAFLLAEEARLWEYDRCVTRTSLAQELGTTLPTLRRRSAAIRTALHPLRIDLPDPEDG